MIAARSRCCGSCHLRLPVKSAQPRVVSGLCVCSLCTQPRASALSAPAFPGSLCLRHSSSLFTSSGCSYFCLSYMSKSNVEGDAPDLLMASGGVPWVFQGPIVEAKVLTLCLLFLTRFLPPSLPFPSIHPSLFFAASILPCGPHCPQTQYLPAPAS